MSRLCHRAMSSTGWSAWATSSVASVSHVKILAARAKHDRKIYVLIKLNLFLFFFFVTKRLAGADHLLDHVQTQVAQCAAAVQSPDCTRVAASSPRSQLGGTGAAAQPRRPPLLKKHYKQSSCRRWIKSRAAEFHRHKCLHRLGKAIF